MKITLLCMGKTDEKEIEKLLKKYEVRLPKHFNYSRIEIPDIKNRKNLSEEQQKIEEEKLFLSKIESSDYVVLLDEKGELLSSKKLAQWLNNQFLSLTQHIVFIIGGPYGFSENIYKRSNYKISLSKMTFTHQMVRLFITEQIYRAYTILQGKTYHHE